MGRPAGTSRAAGYTVSGGRQAGRHYPKQLPPCHVSGCDRPGTDRHYSWGDADSPVELCRVHAAEADRGNGHVVGGCDCGEC